MHRMFNPAVGYNLFGQISRQIKAWALGNVRPALGYSREDMALRLTQRIDHIALNPFLQNAGIRYQAGLDPSPGESATIRCGGLRINTSNGRVVPGMNLFMRSVAGFFAIWVRVFIGFVRGMVLPKRLPAFPVAVVFGIGEESLFVDGNDSRFSDFAKHGPIAPLRQAPCLVIQASPPRPSTSPDRIVYYRHPLLDLMGARPISAVEAASFLADHITAIFRFFMLLFRFPAACLLARDLAYHALAASLNRRRIVDAFVITNSLYLTQPLWMRALPGRQFTTHMVWYSQNSIPFVYKADGVKAHIPSFSHIRVDHVWVWSREFAAYLRDIGVHGEIHAVGPILWYLPESTSHGSGRDAIRIAVFDVTPLNPAFVLKMGLTYNYYREETVSKFVSGLLAVRDELQKTTDKPIDLILKHKRQPQTDHEKGYVRWIQELAATGRITLVPPHTNLYTLISGAEAVVVLPFSSPAHVGIQLGKPTVFFDPTGEILPTREAQNQIEFVAGEKELLDWLEVVLTAPASQSRHHRG